MKKFLGLLITLFLIGNASGQTVMKIYQNNGSVLQIPLSTIDSITYHIATASSISTAAIANITAHTATSGGNIPNDGGSPVTSRGVCWSISSSPTIANNKTVDGNGTGSFTSNISGLLPSTLYYVRAYSTNSVGTTYGSEITFTTSAPPFSMLLTDFDGNGSSTYKYHFYSYLSTPSCSDSVNDGSAFSGTKYWKVAGALSSSNPYYLDGFGVSGAGPLNLGLKDSIVFYAKSMSIPNSKIHLTLTDQKQIQSNGGRGEVFSYNVILDVSDSWIRYSVGVDQLVSDVYDNMFSQEATGQYFPDLASVDNLGFSCGGNDALDTSINISIDDIQIIKVP